MKCMRWFMVAMVALLSLASVGYAADSYPSRPIELVVPFGPGGGSDIFARNFAKYMQQEKLVPVSFNISNKPGGSGVIGYSYVANRKGDPYTIATVSSSFWTTPLVGKSPISYRDFTPVAGLGYDTFLLVTRVQNPYQNLKDLIDAAKKNPDKITVGAPAIAADDAVVTNMLEKVAGIKLNLITFGGSGPALLAALGGHVDITWSNPGEILPQIEAKKVRVLGVSSAKRLAKFPDVPTFNEMGFPVEFAQFRGIIMPKGVPTDAHMILSNAVQKLTKTRSWQTEYVEKNLITGLSQDPEAFGKAIVATNDLYKKVFTDLGVIKK